MMTYYKRLRGTIFMQHLTKKSCLSLQIDDLCKCDTYLYDLHGQVEDGDK